MILAAALCAMEATPAYNGVWADDFNSPPWRGAERATYQRWEFNTNSKTPPPEDDYSNPQGVPSLTVTGDTVLWLASDVGETGVWNLRSGEQYVGITIQNFEEPSDHKKIWLQLTYDDPAGDPIVFAEVGEHAFVGESTFQEATGSYYHGLWEIFIEPNPSTETIKIYPRGCTLYLDEVVVDTICLEGPLCIVEFHHFARFAEHWLDTGCDAGNDWCGGADLDQLGDVGWLDLRRLVDEWLDYCPYLWPLK
jgi:hypothetical protein